MLQRFLDFDGVVHSVKFVLALDDDGVRTLSNDFFAYVVFLEAPLPV